ncbi:hypothetical protein VP01_473g6 [Puccinia sorghi]|uniref:Zn(2)-C6 fungal-type domain-containing protein n=1 Tax=Puccinia sorghi TaxID=27349 RepID=A0A0L6UMW4_9BASI|nr:hypothetical protein VP01_473g6 [Puccinia sorghi]
MDLNEIDYDLGLFLESAPESLLSRPIQSGSAAEGPSPKREVKGARRVRNACLQCRKRKIRCSRTYPCKGCVSRGDGAACDWQGGFPTGNIPIYQKHVADQRRQIEQLKDRITSAKACLSFTVRNNPNLKLEVGSHQRKPSFILATPTREESLSWVSSTGSSTQPPGSALSNISDFSTNTADSSQGGSNEDITAGSPLSADLHASMWKERNPLRLFEMRHRSAGYRPLSFLREENDTADEGSRPYIASSHSNLPRTPVSNNQLTPSKSTLYPSSRSDFLDLMTLDRRNPQLHELLNHKANAQHSPTAVNINYQGTMKVDMPTSHQLPLFPSFAPTVSNWQLRDPKEAPARSYERRRGNPSEVDSGSPITPSRHSHNLCLPYAPSLRGDEVTASSGGGRGMCPNYLPHRQYFGGQDVEPPPTDSTAFNLRDLPWTGELSPSLEQRIQANVAFGLMNMGEPYNFPQPSANLGEESQLENPRFK